MSIPRDTSDHHYDPVAVDRALKGVEIGRRLTCPERAAVVHALDTHPDRYPIAVEHLGLSHRELVRIRAEHNHTA